MKRKAILGVGIAVIAVFIIVVAIWGRNYYQNRYVGSDYYTMVPMDYNMEMADMYSMDGDVVGQGITYTLTAFNSDGESKTVEFNVMEGRGTFPEPGTYLHVSASPTIVVGWNVTTEEEIPATALSLIQGAN